MASAILSSSPASDLWGYCGQAVHPLPDSFWLDCVMSLLAKDLFQFLYPRSQVEDLSGRSQSPSNISRSRGLDQESRWVWGTTSSSRGSRVRSWKIASWTRLALERGDSTVKMWSACRPPRERQWWHLPPSASSCSLTSTWPIDTCLGPPKTGGGHKASRNRPDREAKQLLTVLRTEHVPSLALQEACGWRKALQGRSRVYLLMLTSLQAVHYTHRAPRHIHWATESSQLGK